MKTIKDICEQIWILEEKHNLLDFEIDGVKIWQFIRMEIFFNIAQATKVIEAPQFVKKGFVDKVKSFVPYLIKALFQNPLYGNKNADVLIFDHERHKRVQGENIDIYTEFLIRDLKKQKVNFLVMERPYLRKHFKIKNSYRKYLDAFMIYSYFKRKLSNYKLSQEKLGFVTKLNNELNSIFRIKLDLPMMFEHHVQRFNINYELFSILLKKRNPKQIFIVVNYGQGDLIKAAKDLGVEVIELQHGTISKYHLGYSYPNAKVPLDYFPDKLHVWNEFWKDIIKYPIPDQDIVVKGFSFFNQQKDRYATNKKIDNQIIVLSQGSIGNQMSEIILENYQFLKDYIIIYKLHPGEYTRWQNYKALVELSKFDNVTIVKDSDLYELFSFSKYQIGVYSTAIYEGLEFDCQTVLLELPGVEYMDKLLETKRAVLLKDFVRENTVS